MSFFNRTEAALLNSLCGKTSAFGALASAPTLYLGLSTTTPAEDGTNITEPSGGSYARVATAAAAWNAATQGDPSSITNASVVTLPTATADWASGANMTYFVLFDAPSSGNPVLRGALATPKPVLNGDTPSFPAGSLQITLD